MGIEIRIPFDSGFAEERHETRGTWLGAEGHHGYDAAPMRCSTRVLDLGPSTMAPKSNKNRPLVFCAKEYSRVDLLQAHISTLSREEVS